MHKIWRPGLERSAQGVQADQTIAHDTLFRDPFSSPRVLATISAPHTFILSASSGAIRPCDRVQCEGRTPVPHSLRGMRLLTRDKASKTGQSQARYEISTATGTAVGPTPDRLADEKLRDHPDHTFSFFAEIFAFVSSASSLACSTSCQRRLDALHPRGRPYS